MSPGPAAPSRQRQRGVANRILELLSAGPLQTQDLLSRCGCSAAALFLNLKALRARGAIVARREGRAMRYALAGAPAAPKARQRAAASPDALTDAVRVLLANVAPIDNAADKIRVLEHLAATLPAPVASLLADTAADLRRLTAAG